MTNNPYEPYENDINNTTEPTPDFTPDEYYQHPQPPQQPITAEEYAKYGEDFYSENPAQPTESTPEPEPMNSNPYKSDYNSNPYQSEYNNPYTSDYNSHPYNSGYNTNPYTSNTSNPYASAPYTPPVYATKPQKVKKEKKPVTRNTLVAILIISILCSAVLGTAGGYLVSSKLRSTSVTSGGLTINKVDGESGSRTEKGATLSTKEIVNIAADTVVEITTEMVVTGTFSQQYIEEGAGSGVIISKDGYIVTNYHVIEGASQISVTLRGQNNSINAKLIGVYEAGDLALIKIDSKTELTAATFGNSDKLNVGDYAVAIGNPLGQLGGTVTDGIISALDREVTIDGQAMNLLQTNAEISPGNSGGGLFNGNGELIGIVNAKSSTQAAEGLGFAIPVNDVQDVLSDLKQYGYVRGQIYLGMSLLDISSTAEAWMYGVTQSGVYVASVDNGSNAAKAGFYGGDIILQVNGTDVKTTAEVDAIIDKLKVGDTVSFKVYRNGETGTLKMVLEEYTRSNGESIESPQNQDIPSIWDAFGY